MSRPATFPWLDHLRRDRRGLPVPYVNAWGPETPGSYRVAHDARVGGVAMFRDDYGDEADFTRQNPQRQRECVVDGLCQVCGKFVPWSRRNLVLASVSVEWSYVAELRREVPVVMEPWLCDRCCAIAVSWCPALIRRSRADRLEVFAVRAWREVQLVTSVGSIDSMPGTRERPVFMWAKLRLLTVDIRRAPQVVAAG